MINLFNENGKVNTEAVTANVTVDDFIRTMEQSNFNYAFFEVAEAFRNNGYFRGQTVSLLSLLQCTEFAFAYDKEEQHNFIKYMVEKLQGKL